MEYQNPIAEVVRFEKQGDIFRTVLKLSPIPSSPIAPASLHFQENTDKKILDLHKVVHQTKEDATFETYGGQVVSLQVGDKYEFLSWWTPDQLQMAQSETEIWREEIFVPRDAVKFEVDGTVVYRQVLEGEEVTEGTLIKEGWEHEHCALCWKTISQHRDHDSRGYTDGKEWLCKKCYEEYIVSGFGKKLGE